MSPKIGYKNIYPPRYSIYSIRFMWKICGHYRILYRIFTYLRQVRKLFINFAGYTSDFEP